jgi:AcrR family transcriptional regulator
MLQSNRWIASESEAVSGGDVAFGNGLDGTESCVEITLSACQIDTLNRLGAAHGLDQRVVLSRLIDAALAGPEGFDRGDRHRLRRCVALLRALEIHVARAARSMSVRQLPPDLTARRVDELLDLGGYLHRVGSALLPLLRRRLTTEFGQAEIRRHHEALLGEVLGEVLRQDG